MKRAALLFILAMPCVEFGVHSANAQMIADPARMTEVGYFEGGGMLLHSTIKYEEEEVARNIFGVYGSYGLTDYFDVYASLGLCPTVEPDGWDKNGHGFLTAVGARGFIWGSGPLSVYGYGQLQYVAEDYGEYSERREVNGAREKTTIDAEATLVELSVGAMAEYAVTEQLKLYGGVELIPYSDGEVERTFNYHINAEETGIASVDEHIDIASESRDHKSTYDVRRDIPIVLRGGVKLDFGYGWWLRGEVALGGETAFGIGVGVSF